MILAQERFEVERDQDLGWKTAAGGGLDVRIIPGAHLTILKEPYVQQLAKEIRAAFVRSLEPSKPGSGDPGPSGPPDR
jgi:thioesterase domain-containing protein